VLAFTASDRGDAVAVEVIHNAATELAAMAVVTARRLELDSRLFLAMTGAVLIQNPAFQREVIAEMKAAGMQISDAIIVENAVAGAVNMANWLAETVNK
jgi:N-acetylglucosamine kinase-like BadF-type ATPase